MAVLIEGKGLLWPISNMEDRQRMASDSSLKTLRIFLVEDVPAVRDLIVSSLSDLNGITWSGFSDSENDAIEKLQTSECNVLIVDIELKQGNGMSLLKRLAQAQSQKESLKIIFSNNVCNAYRRAGSSYGVQHFFDKSFELPELHALLLQYLRENSLPSQSQAIQ